MEPGLPSGRIVERVGDLTTLKLDTPIEVTPYHLITLSGKRLSPIAARLRELLLSRFLSRGR